ncbi:gliding motility-associated C-terminal domain-containing protein [Spirosoma sp. KUDC1026]|uniref:gliding motility-associated C-terminal domain-containing protein n=1 Tax=Spirosoma sp. KUDC1026 TaxID=2745947 RepID=UPI00159BE5D5|nr:gliding motility-associated C-terminal domain-containing protein [Spirosoma sp. KUDC1026]QKZ13195.1 gliding motility-associated C-terminal domain-containing protein [Spirosoma sp. KUDC1026]
MRLFTFQLISIVLLVSKVAWATHQVGGQLEMRPVNGATGRYRFIVTNYLESGARADRQGGGLVGIFRKRDNVQMTNFRVAETGTRQSVIFANAVCAAQGNLNFIVATFEAEVQLNPTTYNDPMGYYVSYQTGNRNGGLVNIISPLQIGFTFYLEFPALSRNGSVVVNSSPHFGTINGEYLCLGEPFTFAFNGVDPDGDELRYSMVTPLDRRSTNQNGVSPGPYPEVPWVSNYSNTASMSGNPNLTVNVQTGQLSVTPDKLGLFVFAVKVEEYRSGVKIGEVRRDFQFLVVECPPTIPPAPVIQLQDQPVTMMNKTLCLGESTLLRATLDTGWNYQWQRDGINITNATSATLVVQDAGEYTVAASLKAACSKTGKSQSISVRVAGAPVSLKTNGHLCATTGTMSLKVSGGTGGVGLTYQWFRNNQSMNSSAALDSILTTQDGKYYALITDPAVNCTLHTDTITLTRSVAVVASLSSATGQSRICPQEALALQSGGGVSYVWRQNGQPNPATTGNQFQATTAGSYVVTAVDIFGCEGTSSPLTLTMVPAISVQLDSIKPMCGVDAPVYNLVGSPAGGEFAGAGVSGMIFSPKQAGIGNHALTYAVKAAPECQAQVKTRMAVVAPIPTIQFDESIMTVYRGKTFPLAPGLTGNPTVFSWTPATYLSSPSVADPVVTDIENGITYKLDVSNDAGCQASDTIRVIVVERIWLPSAFSPNGDGKNDVWELTGIEAFPDAIVTIFNRWGEVIYQSDKGYTQPFDGKYNGTVLPEGVYPYWVRTIPDKPPLSGKLVLVR